MVDPPSPITVKTLLVIAGPLDLPKIDLNPHSSNKPTAIATGPATVHFSSSVLSSKNVSDCLKSYL